MNKKVAVYTIFCVIVLVSTFAFAVKSLIVTDISLVDEAHMIATSYRFYIGDAPLVDDWSSEQLHGIVLLPLIYLYHLFSGSNDGIFIFLRIIYLLLKVSVLVYGFVRLRHKNNWSMIYAGLLLWYFFTPYNIETLTYQETPQIFLMFALIVVSIESSVFEYTLLGFFYALSILSQPFWILSYLFILIWIIYSLRKQETDGKKVVAFHIGILAVFIAFVLLVFSRASLSDIIINLPYIFSEQDHDFTKYGILEIVYNKILIVYKNFIISNEIVTIINVVYLFLIIVLGDRRERIRWLMPVFLGISCLSMLSFNDSFLMNKIFIPFLWTGVENLFYVKNRKYYFLLFLGFLFSVATALGTNTGVLATSASLAIYSCTVLFYSKDSFGSNWCELLKWISIIYVLGMVLFFRIYITWGGVISIDNYKNKITDGPMNGLFTDDALYEKYYTILGDINELELDNTKAILFCGTSTPIAYLYAETEYGTMGTPFFNLNYERLNEYFKLHPDKVPTAVYYTKFTDNDEKSEFYKSISVKYEIVTIGERMLAKLKKE